LTQVMPDENVDYKDHGNRVRTGFGYDERGFTKLTNTYKLSPLQAYSRRDYWRETRGRITAWKENENGKEKGGQS
jgi:hypothetical protein